MAHCEYQLYFLMALSRNMFCFVIEGRHRYVFNTFSWRAGAQKSVFLRQAEKLAWLLPVCITTCLCQPAMATQRLNMTG